MQLGPGEICQCLDLESILGWNKLQGQESVIPGSLGFGTSLSNGMTEVVSYLFVLHFNKSLPCQVCGLLSALTNVIQDHLRDVQPGRSQWQVSS